MVHHTGLQALKSVTGGFTCSMRQVKRYQTLSASTVGTILGYSSSFIVSSKSGWIYLIDSEGKKYKTLSESTVGEVIGVTGDNFTSRKSGWIYTWDKNGNKVSTRAAR